MDLAILRLATYEILFEDEIPQNVSINEAVELSKRYSVRMIQENLLMGY